MGLIKSGMKYGSLIYIANKAGKVYTDNHQQQQQPQQSAAIPPQQTRDISGYQHQPWCNGRCDQHCNDAAMYASNNGLSITSAPAGGEADAYYNAGNAAPVSNFGGNALPQYSKQ